MANNIKGITIDIDGNFTQLDKGISEADKKAAKLQNELKQINSQLKFDPRNAVLLQQKFDVLTQKVQATREKLKQLEDAQEQVEEQFKNGEIGEEQYRAFQRELEKTRGQLERFEAEAEDAKKDIDNLGKETDQTGDEFKEMGNDAQASSKKVGDGFNTTAINMSAVTNIIRNIGTIIQSAIQGAINLGKKIAGLITDYYDAVDEINTNAAKYGISTDTYQRWKYASEVIDVSAETMGAALGKLAKQIGKSPEKFDQLGVSIYKASGAYRDSEDIFYDVVDALGRIDDETEQDIIANELFGRSFQELKPLVDAGTDSLKELGDRAAERGAIMTPEELERMQKAKDALDELHGVMATALAPVIEALSPTIEKIANWIAEKLADPKVQKLLEEVGNAMAQILEGVAGLIADAIESGELEKFIDWLIENLPDIAQFIIDIVGGLKDVVKGIKQLIDWGKEAGKAIEKWTNAAAEDFVNMNIDTVKAFNGMETSGKDSFASISGAWMNTMQSSWSAFSEWGTNVKNFFAELPGKIGAAFNSAAEKISAWFDKIGQWFRDLPNKIWNWIKSIPEKIAKAFSGQATVSANGKIGYHGSYAEGGIFRKSSFVNIGEAGPEVVLPLDKLGQVLSSVGYKGSGSIIVNAPVQVVKELNDAELNRVGGRLTDIVGRQFAKRTGGVL